MERLGLRFKQGQKRKENTLDSGQGSISTLVTNVKEGEEGEKQKEDGKCSICIETFTTLCHLLPCHHTFDYDCIYTWFVKQLEIRYLNTPLNLTCPHCRTLTTHISTTNPTELRNVQDIFRVQLEQTELGNGNVILNSVLGAGWWNNLPSTTRHRETGGPSLDPNRQAMHRVNANDGYPGRNFFYQAIVEFDEGPTINWQHVPMIGLGFPERMAAMEQVGPETQSQYGRLQHRRDALELVHGTRRHAISQTGRTGAVDQGHRMLGPAEGGADTSHQQGLLHRNVNSLEQLSAQEEFQRDWPGRSYRMGEGAWLFPQNMVPAMMTSPHQDQEAVNQGRVILMQVSQEERVQVQQPDGEVEGPQEE